MKSQKFINIKNSCHKIRTVTHAVSQNELRSGWKNKLFLWSVVNQEFTNRLQLHAQSPSPSPRP